MRPASHYSAPGDYRDALEADARLDEARADDPIEPVEWAGADLANLSPVYTAEEMSGPKPLYETEINDVCIVVKLNTHAFGSPLYSSLDEFVKANQEAVKQIARHVDGVEFAQVSSDINGTLPVLETWNWKEWHHPKAKGEA